jgi:hypothetical protein
VGGLLSVLVSAVLAVAELLLSGIRMPAGVLGLSLALFAVSAVFEGAITVAVASALEGMQPDFVRKPSGRRSYALGALASAAVLLAVVGVLAASTHPDGLEKLAQNIGIASHAKALVATPLAGYEAAGFASPWLGKAAAGLTGLGLIFGACVLFGRYAARKRSGT